MGPESHSSAAEMILKGHHRMMGIRDIHMDSFTPSDRDSGELHGEFKDFHLLYDHKIGRSQFRPRGIEPCCISQWRERGIERAGQLSNTYTQETDQQRTTSSLRLGGQFTVRCGDNDHEPDLNLSLNIAPRHDEKRKRYWEDEEVDGGLSLSLTSPFLKQEGCSRDVEKASKLISLKEKHGGGEDARGTSTLDLTI